MSIVIRPPPHADAAWQAAEESSRARIEPDLLPWLAPFLIGAILDSIMMGVVWEQLGVWREYHAEKEPRRVKVLVYWLLLTTFANTIFVWVYMHRQFVAEYGYFVQFEDGNWASTVFILYALGKVPVTLFFGERAWRLTNKSMVLTVVLGLLVTVSFAGALVSKVFYSMGKVDEFGVIAVASVVVWLSGEVISDVIITGVIAVQLIRSRTGWSGTDRLITQLLRLVIESQLPPTIVATAFLITLFTKPGSTITHLFMAAPKVYVICLMAVLNRKSKLRRQLESSQEWKPSSRGATRPGVSIQTEVQTVIEMDPLPQRPTTFTNREPLASGLEVQTRMSDGRAEEGREMYAALGNARRARFQDEDKSPFDDYSTEPESRRDGGGMH